MKRQPQPYDGPTTLGLDTSKWQDADRDPATVDVDFGAAFEAGARFAICRSGDGRDPDRFVPTYIRAARDAGLLTGVYHYLRGVHSGTTQAEHALEVGHVAGVTLGLVAADIEGAPAKVKGGALVRAATGLWRDPSQPKAQDRGISHERALGAVEAFVERVHKAGQRAIVYGGQALHWYVAQLPEPPEWLLSLPLWVADYRKVPRVPVLLDGSPAWPPWQIWQYTGHGELPGVPGPIDLNRFRGDEAELERWWSPVRRTTPRPSFDRFEIDALAARAKAGGDICASIELTAAGERLRKARKATDRPN